jgi:hypothetical protein
MPWRDRLPTTSPPWDEDFAVRFTAAGGPLDVFLRSVPVRPCDVARAVGGELRVFGRTVDVTAQGFTWRRDVLWDHEFPNRYVRRLRPAAGQGDVIVPWELSRLQFIPLLAAADRAGDPRALPAFLDLTARWAAANPCERGPNWMIAMESAVRGVNLGVGLLQFRGRLGAAEAGLRGLLWQHVRHVAAEEFKESNRLRNNHHLVAAAGLLIAAACFAGPEARRLADAGAAALADAVAAQFDAEGVNVEGATAYHALSLEAGLWGLAALLARDADAAVRAPLRERLASALGVTRAYLAACGESPQFGDSSDGRILFGGDYYAWRAVDHGWLLRLGEAVGVSAPTPVPLAVYAAGLVCHDLGRWGWAGMATTPPAGHLGGHQHCDKGSLVVRVGDGAVFVDSGTYCYGGDPAARHRFRTTAAHNVLQVDGAEQGECPAAQLFVPPAGVTARVEPTNNAVRLCVAGFPALPEVGEWVREVAADEGGLTVREHLAGTREHELAVRLHLAPDCAAVPTAAGVIVRRGERELGRVAFPEGWAATVEPSEYSPGYGEREPNQCVVWTRRAALPARWTWRFELAEG